MGTVKARFTHARVKLRTCASSCWQATHPNTSGERTMTFPKHSGSDCVRAWDTMPMGAAEQCRTQEQGQWLESHRGQLRVVPYGFRTTKSLAACHVTAHGYFA